MNRNMSQNYKEKVPPRPRGEEGWLYVYEQGNVLAGEEGKGREYKALVKSKNGLNWKIMYEGKRYICAILNTGIEGTIYFGVGDNKDNTTHYEHGEIVGLPVENFRDDIKMSLQNVLDHHIKSDGEPLSDGGDRCVSIFFVPVKIKGKHSNLYVVEIEVARDWGFCKDYVYYCREWTHKRGGKGNQLRAHFNVNKHKWVAFIRTHKGSESVKSDDVQRRIKKPLKKELHTQNTKHGGGVPPGESFLAVDPPASLDHIIEDAVATQSLGRRDATRLNRLLVEGGEAALRRTFKQLHPPEKLVIDLKAKYMLLRELRRKNVIDKSQWEKIFLAHGAEPNSDTFDFALLCSLMVNVFSLPSVPSATDVSEMANIIQLKSLYDELKTCVSVDKQTYITKRQEISSILKNLGLSQEEMDGLKGCSGEKQEVLGGAASLLAERAESNNSVGVDANSVGSCDLSTVQPETQNDSFNQLQCVEYLHSAWQKVMSDDKLGLVIHYREDSDPVLCEQKRKQGFHNQKRIKCEEKNTTLDQLMERLGERASKKGLIVVDQDTSGNCMLYSLSDQLKLVKNLTISPGDLRQSIVQHLRENPNWPELYQFVRDQYPSWKDYLTDMEKDGTWGDHLFLQAASDLYETTIYVINSESRKYDVTINPRGGSRGGNFLILGHVRELHYVSLQPAPDSSSEQSSEADENDDIDDNAVEPDFKHQMHSMVFNSL